MGSCDEVCTSGKTPHAIRKCRPIYHMRRSMLVLLGDDEVFGSPGLPECVRTSHATLYTLLIIGIILDVTIFLTCLITPEGTLAARSLLLQCNRGRSTLALCISTVPLKPTTCVVFLFVLAGPTTSTATGNTTRPEGLATNEMTHA